MESSKLRDGEGDAEDDGLYVIIVDSNIDEQPKNIDDDNTLSSTINTVKGPDFFGEKVQNVENEDIKTYDESEAMVEEYISDGTYVTSDIEQDTTRRKQRKMPLESQKSYVSELRRTNPQLKGKEALISALCKKMTSTKAPPLPDDVIIQRKDNFECSYCRTKRPHEWALALHWRQMHGPRYLICLACGADFRSLPTLYKHERLCGAPDAWLVLEARNRVKQHRKSGPRTKKGNKIEESKPKRRPLKRTRAAKGKSNPRAKKRRKVEESRPAKRPVHRSKKGQLSIRQILQDSELDSDSDMSLKVNFVKESEEDCDSDELYKPAADEESEKDSGLSCSDDDQSPHIRKSKAKKPISRPRNPTGEKSGQFKGSKPMSYINELCKESPELLQNQELLIDTLSEIMAKEKRPPPPEDFATLNSDMLYECSLCEFADRSMPAAARHWQRRHGPPCFHCYACDAQFRDPASLYRHEKSVCKAKETYVVLKARARSVVWNGRNNRPFMDEPHVMRPGGRKFNRVTGLYDCSMCPRQFKVLLTLKAHENKHRGERPFRCKECPASYVNAGSLNSHTKRRHREASYMCDKCDSVFPKRSALRNHMDTHLPPKKFACTECEKRYAYKFDLTAHVNQVHRLLPPPCACSRCPKRYPKLSLLRKHMLQQHGVTVIGRRMQDKQPKLSEDQLESSTVVKEINVKTGQNNLQYTIELKLDNNVLQEVTHTDDIGKKKVACPFCEKLYAYQNDLKNHVNRIHLQLPQPYACTECPKRFAKKIHVREHLLKKHEIIAPPENLRRQTKGEPKIDTIVENVERNTKESIEINEQYLDTEGSAESQTIIDNANPKNDAEISATEANDESASQDAIHIVTSVTKKNFACSECEKQYANKTDLRNHVDRKHLNLPQPYACKLCPKRYSKMAVLKNHMLQIHGMKIITQRTLLKDLPNLTEEQLKSVTIVKKSELNPHHSDQNTIETIEFDKEITMNTEGLAVTRSIEENATLMNQAEIPEATCDDTSIDAEMYTDSQDNIETEIIQDEEIDNLHQYVILKDEEGINIVEYYRGADDGDEEGINNDEYYEEMVNDNEEGINIDENYEETIDDDEKEVNNDEYYEEMVDDDEEEPNNDEYYEETLDEYEESDEDQKPPEDLLEIVMDRKEDSQKKKPMLVIKDGQAVFMDGNSIGYFKKSSNCKYNTSNKKAPSPAKVTVQLAEEVISEANKAMLDYCDKFCKPSTNLRATTFQRPKIKPKHKYQLRKKK